MQINHLFLVHKVLRVPNQLLHLFRGWSWRTVLGILLVGIWLWIMSGFLRSIKVLHVMVWIIFKWRSLKMIHNLVWPTLGVLLVLNKRLFKAIPIIKIDLVKLMKIGVLKLWIYVPRYFILWIFKIIGISILNVCWILEGNVLRRISLVRIHLPLKWKRYVMLNNILKVGYYVLKVLLFKFRWMLRNYDLFLW